jgi:hypothetical protein
MKGLNKMSKAVKERKQQKRFTRIIVKSVEKTQAIQKTSMSVETNEYQMRQSMKQMMANRPMGNY